MTLVFEEQESDALVEWLAAPGDVPIVSSALAPVEVLRTRRRVTGLTRPGVDGARSRSGGTVQAPQPPLASGGGPLLEGLDGELGAQAAPGAVVEAPTHGLQTDPPPFGLAQ